MKNVAIAILLAAATLAAQTAPAKKPAAATNKPASSSKTTTTPATTGPPTATIQTTAGTLSCELFPDKAPNAVANFAGLARGTKDWTDPRTGAKKHGVPLYDGTIFHRVIPEFMIQGGDPIGTGMGGPGYEMKDEFSPDLTFNKPGMLAYANSGPNTNGSQFFITEVPVPFLDPCLDEGGCLRGSRRVPKGYGYTIFGHCTPATVDLVKQIARAPRNGNDRPNAPVTIKHIAITGLKPAARPAAKPAPKAGTAAKPGTAAKKAPAK
ncbi:MAG TPA: peptidylprolyl isomerase [Terriglobales bacterium]|nr:peptidylprolyl isomerase [Terriglobales bacterium]